MKIYEMIINPVIPPDVQLTEPLISNGFYRVIKIFYTGQLYYTYGNYVNNPYIFPEDSFLDILGKKFGEDNFTWIFYLKNDLISKYCYCINTQEWMFFNEILLCFHPTELSVRIKEIETQLIPITKRFK